MDNNSYQFIPNEDGTYSNDKEELFVNLNGEFVPLVSPYDGSKLYPNGDGTFSSETDDLVYEIKDGEIVGRDRAKQF